MRWIAAVVVLFLAAQSAWAEPGGYQLFSKDGTEQTPDGATTGVVSWDIIGQTAGDKQAPVDLSQLISRTVIECERVARVPPPDQATTAQMHAFEKKKKDDLKKAVEPARGEYVFETVHVQDVIEAAKPEHGKYMVFADVDWTSWTVLPDADANTVEHLEEQRVVKNPDVPRGEIDQRIAAVKQGAEARKPVQMVYFLTNDENVAKWKRDSRQKIRGYVQTVAAFVYPQAKDAKSDDGVRCAYVGLEFIIADVK